jgi:hypothetical protein
MYEILQNCSKAFKGIDKCLKKLRGFEGVWGCS